MPRGDGTGPLGLGPMTGRAAGYCAGYPMPGFVNPLWGSFRGRSRVALPSCGARFYDGSPWAAPSYGNPWTVGYGPCGPGFGRGLGMGFGRGRGRGFRRFFW
ncbi:MAG: hypothetical protein A4E73_03818 [Syntrophaceae bacterium PtaU1.Bin231]|nr:MAG: hypothetical protein A4E73_03818 [Syntrophaceae bacterium PtaU1.Bin231]